MQLLRQCKGRTLMVDPPQGPLEPLASSTPSHLSVMHSGHVAVACLPCNARSRTHRAVSHTLMHTGDSQQLRTLKRIGSP